MTHPTVARHGTNTDDVMTSPRVRVRPPFPAFQSFPIASRPALGPTLPPGALTRSMKRPERDEPDHSPPTSAGFKNAWSYTSTPQYVFMTCA